MKIVKQVFDMSRNYEPTLRSIVVKERLSEVASLLIIAIKRMYFRERENSF